MPRVMDSTRAQVTIPIFWRSNIPQQYYASRHIVVVIIIQIYAGAEKLGVAEVGNWNIFSFYELD